jgi:glycosyltransferase involved in cell wall biosynthesis
MNSDKVPEKSSIIKKSIAIIPAYNEELAIGSVVLRTVPFVSQVVVIDDGSQDHTVEIAQLAGAVVIKHEKNLGYGAALQTIFTIAQEMDSDEFVILDADGQHNPSDIPKLLAALRSGADIAIGSRFLTEKSSVPHYRKIGIKILDRATNFAGKISISDSQSGFRAYSRTAIEKLTIQADGMAAGSEILIRAGHLGLVIAEVPINTKYDIPNISSSNPLVHGITVLSNIVGLISYRRPLISFGIPGFIVMVIGVYLAFWVLSLYTTYKVFPYTMTVVCGVCLMLGLMLINTALILNSVMQLTIKSRNK